MQEKTKRTTCIQIYGLIKYKLYKHALLPLYWRSTNAYELHGCTVHQ